MTKAVSVIIPLAKGEGAWRDLLDQLDQLDLPEGSEIILAAGEQNFTDDFKAYPWPFQLVREGMGRAGQMNAGAHFSTCDWLWFLHADTKFGDGVLEALGTCISENSETLYFFDLRFQDDGPSAVSWNEWAVKWRAGTLKLPFGDQAFLVRKDVFFKLGAYREDLLFGEDHVLVWKAHQMEIPVKSANAAVYTSARRYKDHGWLATTSRFVWLTIKQGFPQLMILLQSKLKRVFT